MQVWFRAGVIAALLMWSAVASGQSLPAPGEFYFDEDASSLQSLEVVEGSGDAAMRRLLRMAERDGRNADRAHAQLAGLLMSAGRSEEGKALYQQLLTRLDENNGLRRPVVWRYGWALYRAGEPEAALAQWSELLNARGTNPSWAPPTLAMALWKLDRRDQARQWYAAAVRTWPDRWTTPAQYPRLLPDWSGDERATLAEVQAAWAKAPPAWP